MSYEFWIPVLFISLACGALLIDFDLAGDPSSDEDADDDSDLSATETALSQDAEFAAPVDLSDLAAANSPHAPDGFS